MPKVVNRLGEKGNNKFGSQMVIMNYKGANNVDVFFPEYNWITYGVEYRHFKLGGIKCPYERRTYGVGYLGEGKYKRIENGLQNRAYHKWVNMFERCYSDTKHRKNPTYKGCTVCEEWHNYQNFAKWFEDNYYEIENEEIHLDKDILVEGNKLYSPKTCLLVPKTINLLFLSLNRDNGFPRGVSVTKSGSYRVVYNGVGYGCYKTVCEASDVYKNIREKRIKEVAEKYKIQIPYKLYEKMLNYKMGVD